MASILAIVEGDGELHAVPVLLRRIAQEVVPADPPRILKPIRVHRSRVVKQGVLEAMSASPLNVPAPAEAF